MNPSGKVATWTLLDDPAQGKVQLVHRREPKTRQAEFAVSASLVTRAGVYTGHVEDGAGTSHIDIDFGMNDANAPGYLSLSAQVDIKPGPRLLHAAPEGQGMPMGGTLTVEQDGATWTGLIAQHDKDAAGRGSLVHRQLETRHVNGSLADPRVDSIGRRLAGLRAH